MSSSAAEVLPEETSPSEYQPIIMCVDDEKDILSALKRLFRRNGKKILTANSGDEALEKFNENKIDLIISDMRMPEMTGAELLKNVAENWPDTMRILLTGYSDMESTVAAVNEGKIYRYLAKPWDENDLLATADAALEQKLLKDEKLRLQKLTEKQNSELAELNSSLESKVEARTHELAKASKLIKESHEKLKNSYKDAISVFSHLIELREGVSAGHSQKIADHAKIIAEKLGMDENTVDEVYFAGLLHDIGKIGLEDELFKSPYSSLNDKQKEKFHEHPIIGQNALLPLPMLENAGAIIRSHHELFNGKGYPDALSGDQIPLGARIICLVNDFEDYRCGKLTGKPTEIGAAITYIEQNSGQRYDQNVVKAFKSTIDKDSAGSAQVNELTLSSDDLQPGMVLTQDVISDSGLLLLKKGQELNEGLIEKIQELCSNSTEGFSIRTGS